MTTATSLAGPSQPMSRRDLTSAFGAKRKWTGRQSSLPRSKMTHNGSVAELSGARAQSFRHDCPPYLAFEFAGARTETFTSHRRLLHGKAGRAQEPQYGSFLIRSDSRSPVRASPVKRHEHVGQKRSHPFWRRRSGASSKWRTQAAAM
jgi:hypothetical protein